MFRIMFLVFDRPLFANVFRDGDDFRTDYYWKLSDNGVIMKGIQQLRFEMGVMKEVGSIPADEIASELMARNEFAMLAKKNICG